MRSACNVMLADFFQNCREGLLSGSLCYKVALTNDHCTCRTRQLVKTDIWSLKQIDVVSELEMGVHRADKTCLRSVGGGGGDFIPSRVMASLLKSTHARDK